MFIWVLLGQIVIRTYPLLCGILTALLTSRITYSWSYALSCLPKDCAQGNTITITLLFVILLGGAGALASLILFEGLIPSILKNLRAMYSDAISDTHDILHERAQNAIEKERAVHDKR